MDTWRVGMGGGWGWGQEGVLLQLVKKHSKNL